MFLSDEVKCANISTLVERSIPSIRMDVRFYHGTSIGTGLEDGDRFDPSFAQYEPCVWGSASFAWAKYWASSRDAHYDEGEIIFEVVLDDDAKVLTLSEDDGDTISIIEKAKATGYDAVIFEKGEDNAPMIAILNAYTARAKIAEHPYAHYHSSERNQSHQACIS